MSLGSQRRYIPCCGVGPRLKGLDTRSPIGVEDKLRLAGTSYFFFFLAFFLVVFFLAFFFFFERQPQVLHIFVPSHFRFSNPKSANKANYYIIYINRLGKGKSIIIFFKDKWWGKHAGTRKSQKVTKKVQNRNKTVTFGRHNLWSCRLQ